MEVISVRDMQALDINCEYFGLSRLQLMENAGKGLAEEITKRFEKGKIAIFAGLGNNGGDSFVAARHLKGFDIEIYLMGKKDRIKTDIAKRNLQILEKAGFNIREGLPENLNADVVIDGMLGTGVKGKLREPYMSAVDMINESDSFVVAVDLPTGLDADTGNYHSVVKADLTVTFHKLKPGLLKAKDVCGEIVVKDIGIPKSFEELCGVGDVVITYKRDKFAHKGMHGKILVIGGGEYTGAPALTSLAAYASGADIVTTAVPDSIKNIVASFSPNLIVKGLKGDEIGMKNLNEAVELVKKHNVVAIGMGVGKNDEFKDFVAELLKYCKKAVLDADGITGDIPEIECILTPHAGEFKKLFGEPTKDEVLRTAKKLGCTIILKGVEDTITDGDRIKINKTGNPGMTVGGTGDVLAGVASALLCKNDPFHAACAAAFINGLAGDICSEKYGYNFSATQLIDAIPEAFLRCLNFG